jgi:hypothetical protein
MAPVFLDGFFCSFFSFEGIGKFTKKYQQVEEVLAEIIKNQAKMKKTPCGVQ